MAPPDTQRPDAPTRAGSPAHPSADGLPAPRRQWAVLAASLAICMAVIDGSIANVALPTLAQELRVAPATSIWVTNAYQMATAVLLLPMAALGDIHGYRRVYLAGLAVFVLASLGCALSGSLPALVAARVFQGVGAAALMSTNAALVRFIYPRAQLGRGIGVIALVVATSSAVGPTVAGAILAVAHWPWLFAVNIPLGLLALAVGWRSLPESPLSGQPFDWISAILSALTLGLLVSTLDVLAHGAHAMQAGLQLLAAVGAGAVLVFRQLSERAPLLPLDLLRIPIFALSMGTSVCSFMAQMLAYASLPFRLQTGLGLSAVETGLMMTPWPVATALMAPIAGRLADRYHPGLLGGLGLAVFGGGLAALALLPDQPTAFDIGWRMALAGAGFGLFQSPNNRTIVGSAPRERSGAAGGMLSTARLLGQTTGAALVGLVLARAGEHGPVLALWLGAAAAVLAAGVSSLRLLTRRRTA